MKTLKFIVTTLLLASSTVLSAEDEGGLKPYLMFGFNLAHSHSHDLTQKTFGGLNSFSAEFGFGFLHTPSGLTIRPNVGVARMTGADPTEANPYTYDMMGIYGGFDLVYQPLEKWNLPVEVSTGPVFIVWNVDQREAPGNPSQGDKGLKLGWRLSAGYVINTQWRVELSYSLTEWRSSSALPYREGWNPSKPAYFCLKASYSF
jgi:hypothetical protein